jgi:hypothetical protein
LRARERDPRGEADRPRRGLGERRGRERRAHARRERLILRALADHGEVARAAERLDRHAHPQRGWLGAARAVMLPAVLDVARVAGEHRAQLARGPAEPDARAIRDARAPVERREDHRREVVDLLPAHPRSALRRRGRERMALDPRAW